MKYDFDTEKSILLKLENSNDVNGYWFSNHRILERQLREDVRETILSHDDLTPEMDYHLGLMRQSGLVIFTHSNELETLVAMQPSGHTRLDWHRNNTPIRRTLRWFSAKIDLALTSIFLPIVMSILTVVAMRTVGLDVN